jgi:hypothetical protein
MKPKVQKPQPDCKSAERVRRYSRGPMPINQGHCRRLIFRNKVSASSGTTTTVQVLRRLSRITMATRGSNDPKDQTVVTQACFWGFPPCRSSHCARVP